MDEIERFLAFSEVVLDFLKNNKPKIKTIADLATVFLALSTAIMAVGTIWMASINKVIPTVIGPNWSVFSLGVSAVTVLISRGKDHTFYG